MSRVPRSDSRRTLASRRCPSDTASSSGTESVFSGCSEIWDKENRQSVIPPRTDMYSAVRVAWREHFEELPLRNDLATPFNETSTTSGRPDTARLLAEQQAFWVNSRRSVRNGLARLQWDTDRISSGLDTSFPLSSKARESEEPDKNDKKSADAEDGDKQDSCSKKVTPPVPRCRYRSTQVDIYRWRHGSSATLKIESCYGTSVFVTGGTVRCHWIPRESWSRLCRHWGHC